jgi:hypothetical protein
MHRCVWLLVFVKLVVVKFDVNRHMNELVRLGMSEIDAIREGKKLFEQRLAVHRTRSFVERHTRVQQHALDERNRER